jgi:hypothetical protein
MKTPLFVYKGTEYSYVMIDDEPTPYKTHMKMYDDLVIDEDMQKELDVQLNTYESMLNEEELKAWQGEELAYPFPF